MANVKAMHDISQIKSKINPHYTTQWRIHLQLASRLPPLLFFLVSQEPSQDLARWRFRNLIDKLDAACDPLVASFVLLDMLGNVACNNAIVLFNANRRGLHYKCLGNFTRSFVRNLDDGAVGYSRMGKKMRFELRRCDLVTLWYC
jgi:hypothetical protein